MTPLKKNVSHFCIFGVSTERWGKKFKFALIDVKLADAQQATNSKCWKNAFRTTERSVDQGSEVSMELDCSKEYLKDYKNLSHHLSYINIGDS